MSTTTGFDFNGLDASVRPTDDFYSFVNSIWLKENPIPQDQPRWGSFSELHATNLKRLHGIIREITEDKSVVSGSNRQKLRDFWFEFMDDEKRNDLGIEPLKEELDLIDSIKSSKDFQNVIARLHLLGVGVFWSFDVGPDDKNPIENIAFMSQSGMGLPSRDYYFDEQFEDVREKYRQYIQRIFVLLGYDQEEARQAEVAIMRIETCLAEHAMRPQEARDIDNVYNKLTREQLVKLVPEVDWERYLARIGAGEEETFIVTQPDFFKYLNAQLPLNSTKELQYYLRFHLASMLAPQLSDDFLHAHFDFYGRTLSGTQELLASWKRGVELMTSQLDHMISPLYVEQYFDEGAKKHIEVLVANIKEALAARIQRISWMSDATKEKARKKLENFDIMVGYPDNWRSMDGLTIGRHSHIENVLNIRRFNRAYSLGRLGKRVDRKEWGMPAATVNAYIRFELNHLVFPAGILQSPFFNPELDDAFNYGGIGAIIGHEAGHAFDDQGSKYDADGFLNDWWNEEDKEQFKALTNLIVEQFNDYVVLGDVHVNGELTQGENIGDLGGLNFAFEAYMETLSPAEKRKKIGGFTPAQRFFLGWARIWRTNIRPELQRQYINTDPHSPAEWRTNGPLTNINAFHKAFGSRPGDGMYKPPRKRIVIW